jgi:hypothetical protein
MVAWYQTFYGQMEEPLPQNERAPATELHLPIESMVSQGTPGDCQGRLMPQKRPLSRTGRFVRSHPYVAGGGAFIGVGIFAIGLIILRTGSKDTDPSFVHLNVQQGMIEVFNRRREMLWQLPGVDLRSAVDSEFYNQSQPAGTADLDGDGRSEVVCCATLAGPGNEPRRGLSILSSRGDLLTFIQYSRETRFRGIEYPSFYTPSAYVVGQPVNRDRDLFVLTLNERSPMVLVRTDIHGGIKGEYWHFGHLPLVLSGDVEGDGSNDLILGGVNDIEDSRGGRFPVVVILDPRRLNGSSESKAAGGFGRSTASPEKYYIRLPVSDLEHAVGSAGSVCEMSRGVYQDGPVISFWVKLRFSGEIGIAFEYIFTTDYQIKAVRSSGPSEILRARLSRGGELSGIIDSSYLNTLRLGVRYWDGRTWSPNRVCLLPPE